MKSATRKAPKPEKVREAKEDKGAHMRCVLKQIGDGGNDGNLKNGKAIKK
jgi:hypothetical protein